MTLPQGPNGRWSLDFVSDTLADGRRFRVLVVVDDFTGECLALVADTFLSGHRVVRELDRIIERRDRPQLIVSDNGTELTSQAILRWQKQRNLEWHSIAPGKPQQNGLVESLTVAYGTNASTSTSSGACLMLAGSSMRGGPTTTAADLTRASAASPQTSSQPGPSRTTTRTDSGFDRGHSGGRVTDIRLSTHCRRPERPIRLPNTDVH